MSPGATLRAAEASPTAVDFRISPLMIREKLVAPPAALWALGRIKAVPSATMATKGALVDPGDTAEVPLVLSGCQEGTKGSWRCRNSALIDFNRSGMAQMDPGGIVAMSRIWQPDRHKWIIEVLKRRLHSANADKWTKEMLQKCPR